jgi:hypothetical protein
MPSNAATSASCDANTSTSTALSCRGKGPTSACPILDALDEQEAGHGDR